MEECEALCTRLAIMVNGEFKCLGSTQHLKSRFGDGYTLMARIAATSSDTAEKTDSLQAFIQRSCPGSSLKDKHEGYVHYQISNNNLNWAQIFGLMEKIRDEFHIEDYSISQTTLEQVFLNFAKEQKTNDSGSDVKSKSLCSCFQSCHCCDKSNAVHSTHL